MEGLTIPRGILLQFYGEYMLSDLPAPFNMSGGSSPDTELKNLIFRETGISRLKNL